MKLDVLVLEHELSERQKQALESLMASGKDFTILTLRKNKGLESERGKARSKRGGLSEEGIAKCYVRRRRIDMAKPQPLYDPLFLRKVSYYTRLQGPLPRNQ